jgi:hypothetical protein
LGKGRERGGSGIERSGEWLGEHEVENDKHGLLLTLVETVMSIPGIEAVDLYLETVGEVSYSRD